MKRRYWTKFCGVCGGSGNVDVTPEPTKKNPHPRKEYQFCGECEYDGVSYGVVLTDEGLELVDFLRLVVPKMWRKP